MTSWTVVLVGVLLLLGVDAALTWWVRQAAARRLAQAVGAPVDVHVRGWPATVRLPLGRLRGVVLRATDVPAGGTRLRVLEVVLDGVRPRPTHGGGWEVATTGGSFSAHLDPEGFRALAPLPDRVLDVRFVPGRVRFRFPGGVEVAATMSVEDQLVVLVPDVERLEVLSVLRVAFPLEELPFGATVEEVEVVEGAVIVRGSVGGFDVAVD